ncbi:MAG TPA: M50 family metallopeptidase [Kofleriaceae bacterium]|nr:M50 family metallopeptidase [Kofleriaceae bacterium]
MSEGSLRIKAVNVTAGVRAGVGSLSRERALVIALLASLVLWNLPFGGFVLYPFKLFATWLHELSHGLAMAVTGAGFDRLDIYRDTSGISYARGGTTALGAAIIASAGYLGTALFGAGFLVLGQSRRGARTVLVGLASILAISAALWIENRFGIIVAWAGAGMFLLAALISERVAVLVVNFVAAQASINAVLDIRVLFRPNMVINGKIVGRSDAHNMAAATFGNHWLWATVWLVISLALLYAALRIIYVRREGHHR